MATRKVTKTNFDPKIGITVEINMIIYFSGLWDSFAVEKFETWK